MERYNLVLRLFKIVVVLYLLWPEKPKTLLAIQIAGGGQLHFGFRVNGMRRSLIDA